MPEAGAREGQRFRLEVGQAVAIGIAVDDTDHAAVARGSHAAGGREVVRGARDREDGLVGVGPGGRKLEHVRAIRRIGDRYWTGA